MQGYPPAFISAIEPLELQEKAAIEVVRGFAEFLPWPGQSFHTVVASTSLDHMLSLPKALEEIRRVLVPGGRCLVWIGSIPGSPKPLSESKKMTPIDGYHLYHIDAAWFEPMMSEHFSIEERMEFDAGSFSHIFYRFDLKS